MKDSHKRKNDYLDCLEEQKKAKKIWAILKNERKELINELEKIKRNLD